MLHSYQAIYEHGRLQWLGDAPSETRVKVIVTVLDEPAQKSGKRRRPPPELAGTLSLRGDDNALMEPAVPESDWDILR